ncbi:MAG: hypothetical protein ACERIH_08045 [Labilibaculum antarcticum]
MKKYYLKFCIIILVTLTLSCDNDVSEELSFDIPEFVVFDEVSFNGNRDKWDKWDQLNLQNYSYEFGYSPQMDYTIEIKDGEVTNVEIIDSSYPGYLTIDQIFQEIKDAYPENGEIKLNEGDVAYLKEIKVIYNSEYFYPEEVEFIYEVTIPVEIDGFFHRFVGNFVLDE